MTTTGSKPFLMALDGSQHGFHQVDVVHFGAGLSQIRAQRRRLLVQAMALGARQVRLVEQNRPPVHVAVLPRRLSQGGGRLLEQLLFQRNGQRRHVSSLGQAPRQEHQPPASDNDAPPKARHRGTSSFQRKRHFGSIAVRKRISRHGASGTV